MGSIGDDLEHLAHQLTQPDGKTLLTDVPFDANDDEDNPHIGRPRKGDRNRNSNPFSVSLA